MELYNFFSEVVEENKLGHLQNIYDELKDDCVSISLIRFKDKYSLIGQIYGDDTNYGDIDLMVNFSLAGIKYTWLDAYTPSINNLKENGSS